MRVLIREALSQGAVGLSSGLEYTPGSFASTEELVEVHRNYWKAEAALRSIEAAALSGVDVHFDRYPYVAYATGLTNLFPTWARADGTAAFLRRLEDPESSGRLEQYARDKIALLGSWDSIQITFTPTDRNVEVRGRRLGEFAQQSGEEPYALVLRLLQEEQGNVGVVGFGMSEENTALILSHERAMVCSDGGAYAPYGPLSTGSPHPRGYGAFPRVLGLYVRERGDFSLASAVKKMSAMPARKLHLRDRGVLRVGGFADVAVFEPDIVADQATFASPHQYPLGIPHVIVNGVLTLRDGEHTGRRGGRAVRGPT
jgi:N-acyl-D-amino-acid deacylase